MKLRAMTCHEDHGKEEAEPGAKCVEQGLKIVVTAVDVADADTEHSTVCCDQGKENTQGFIQADHVFLHEHLDQLHEGSDDQDEDDGLQISDALAVQELLNRPCNSSCQNHDEGNGNAHARSALTVLGNTKEGADAQELRKGVVVDEDHADNDDHILSHELCHLL